MFLIFTLLSAFYQLYSPPDGCPRLSLCRFDFRGKTLLRALLWSVMLPTVVVAAGFNAAARSAWRGQSLLMRFLAFGMPAILFVGSLSAFDPHVFYNTPSSSVSSHALSGLDPKLDRLPFTWCRYRDESGGMSACPFYVRHCWPPRCWSFCLISPVSESSYC